MTDTRLKEKAANEAALSLKLNIDTKENRINNPDSGLPVPYFH